MIFRLVGEGLKTTLDLEKCDFLANSNLFGNRDAHVKTLTIV